jgi:hypothetical protein
LTLSIHSSTLLFIYLLYQMCKTYDFCGITLAVFVCIPAILYLTILNLLYYRLYCFYYMEISAATISVYSIGTMSLNLQTRCYMVIMRNAKNNRRTIIRIRMLLRIDIQLFMCDEFTSSLESSLGRSR